MTQEEIIIDLKNKLKLVNSKFDVKKSDANVELTSFEFLDGTKILKSRDPNQLDIYLHDLVLGCIRQHKETGIWSFNIEENFYDSEFLKDIFIPAMAAIAESLDQLNKIFQEDTNNG